ncbi:hypothetical protein EVAR_40294_1 [Eumeta japonica]|uniref:Uncharacterized protein n=1 Tax=Eumeta variegata TaxID=151549 RepID=A0A4C1WVY6_EUMVA|nr:hypothetical protein EVAR_40294_1 [Eumeta japonica]
MYADVGCQERISDGGVYRNSSLFQKLQENNLNLPSPSPLPGCDYDLPYVLVTDIAFALHIDIMKPFLGDNQEGSYIKLSVPHAAMLSSTTIVSSLQLVLDSVNAAGQHTGVLTACDMVYGRFLKGSPRHRTSLDTDTGWVRLFYSARKWPSVVG